MPSYRLSSPGERTPFQRRVVGLALAVGVNLVLLLVLLTLGVIPVKLPTATPALVVDLIPAPSPSPERASVAAKARTTPHPLPPRKPKAVPEKPRLPTLHPLDMIEMSNEEFAAADISKLPKSSEGSGASDSKVVGRGPDGEVLYAAEWARKPTDAELSGYLPRNAPDGYGLIACKTIPENRVDDCIELGNDPPGSHLASAVRQAAWQFRVRPPRKNGRPLIGSWVRIRIDYYTARE